MGVTSVPARTDNLLVMTFPRLLHFFEVIFVFLEIKYFKVFEKYLIDILREFNCFYTVVPT